MFKTSWRTFAGVKATTLLTSLKRILDSGPYCYELTHQRPTFREWFVYGAAEDTAIIQVSRPTHITIRIIDVTADPMIRILYPLITSRESYGQLTANISRLEISPVNKVSSPHIGNLLRIFVKAQPKNPWEPLKLHPRFRSAPLLLMAVKRSWEKWTLGN